MIVKVFVEGQPVHEGTAVIAADDPGFLYGAGLFETMRVSGGGIPLLDRHLDRLFRSLPVLGIKPWFAREELAGSVQRIVQEKGIAEAACRLTITAGGLVLITLRPGSPYGEEAYERGFRALWATSRRNECSRLSAVKSLNYADSWLERRKARDAGADEALFLDTRGNLSEGSATNLFFWKGGRLCTPALACGALPGVARGVILDIADPKPVEGEFGPKDLLRAEEAFVTNALMGVMPLVQVEGNPVGSGKPGPNTLSLLAKFKGYIAALSGRVAR